MSLFDSVISAAAGALLKDNEELQHKVAGMINEFFDQMGGLSGLLQKLQNNGLGDLAASWISGDEALPITQEQLHAVVGNDLTQTLAGKAGIDSSLFDSLLAKGLPKLVYMLTAEGQTPEQMNHMDLSKAKELVGKMFS